MDCYIKGLQNKVKVLKNGLKSISGKFYCVGGPLNDNTLHFDDKQKQYFWRLKGQIEKILEVCDE